MDQDDLPVGRVLSRREVLKLLAGGSLGLLVVGCSSTEQATTISATATSAMTATRGMTNVATTPITVGSLPACVVRPEMTEGPYFVDEKLERSDIRMDTGSGVVSAGIPLVLAFNVSQVAGGSCTPLSGAMVDIWHCDANGVYSEFESGANADFLRGYQMTDERGLAQFTTIYPGWYPGRTVHIHFKIRVQSSGGTYDFTSQLFFDDVFTDEVYTQAPYDERGARSTRNTRDNIFNSGGTELLLNVKPMDGQYVSAFDIALDLSG